MLKINKLAAKLSQPAQVLPKLWFMLLFAIIGISCQSGGTPDTSTGNNVLPASLPVPEVQPDVDANYLLGKFDPGKHPDFSAISAPYTDRPGMALRKEAFEAFEKMWKAAQKDGISLKIISSTRTFYQQKTIWETKWKRFEKDAPMPKDRALKILEYSSMPGSSRHHWGTDIDLNDLNNPTFEAGGKYEKVYAWLSAHAHEYGFCQPYTPGRPSGYHEEKWHWSYTPLSAGLLKAYKNKLTDADIAGFIGAETAAEIGIVQNYVLGINQSCK